MEKGHESLVQSLKSKVAELESRNEDLNIELTQYKREQLPDPPDISEMDSQYIASQLSTILGASISNVSPNALEQSRMFLSKINVQNQVLQSDVDELRAELVAKEHAIRRLEADNDRMKRQKVEQTESLDKLKESSTALREDMEAMLSRHREELEAMELRQQVMF